MRALLTEKGWVRTDIIVNVYTETDDHGYAVKIRCQPNPFAWNPVVSRWETSALAVKARDELGELLWMRIL